MKKFIGTGVALITPFLQDESVDVDALKKMVDYQIDNGVDYIVVLGTTAESATLTVEEKELVKKTIVKQTSNRIPLVLGMGDNSTQRIVEQLKTTDFSGFDAILSVSPFYNKPSQDGIYKHFEAVANNSPLPIILYNVPGRTGSNMEPETIARLAQNFENIIGVKEAKGDLVQAMQIIAKAPKDFLVISGDDMITLPMILAGGSGVISVMAEGFPKAFSTMVNLGLNQKVKEAFDWHYKLAPGINLIFSEGNPTGIKSVLQTLGLCNDVVRLPLVPATRQLKDDLDDFISQLK
ncbi:MAG: 4-hydroxy-tetrahydrodipicolinate synthase [Bacteroidota bacterium]